MRNETGRALAALLALVTVVAIAEGVVLIRMDSRLQVVEMRGGVTTGAGAATPLALVDEFRAFEARQEDEIKARESVERKLDALADEIDAVAKAVRESPVIVPPGSAALPAGAIDEAVNRAVDKKIAELPQGKGGEWKPTIGEFQTAFNLSAEQTDQAEQIFDTAKQESFNLLATRRPDGTSKVDDLVAAFTSSDDPEGAVKKFFVSLFQEKIPGREETYIVEILRIKANADSSLRTIFTDEQATTLSRVNLDHLGVKTAYDPFGEYVQEAMK